MFCNAWRIDWINIYILALAIPFDWLDIKRKKHTQIPRNLIRLTLLH